MADQLQFPSLESGGPVQGPFYSYEPGPGSIPVSLAGGAVPDESDYFAAGMRAQFEIDCQVDCAFCADVAAGGTAKGMTEGYGPAVLADSLDPAAGYNHYKAGGLSPVWCDATALRLYWDDQHNGGKAASDGEEPAESADVAGGGPGADSDDGGL